MGLKFDEAYAKVSDLAGSPCAVEVDDEQLWGLRGGLLHAIVFHWPSLAPAVREPFLQGIFQDPEATRTHLTWVDGVLTVSDHDLVPFALLGLPGLFDEGATFENRFDSKLVGVLWFDLQRGVPKTCPVLLWDFHRFGRVAADSSALKLHPVVLGGEVSLAVQTMPQRSFVRTMNGETTYWQIEVNGRQARMQRGRYSAQGQRDWTSNQVKDGHFPSSAEAKVQAEKLIRKYLDDGYLERPSLD